MQQAMHLYFDGEKNAGVLIAAVGAAIVVAAVVLFRGGPGLRSFAVTLGVVAVAEIALGVGLYLRTGPQVVRLEQQLQSAPAAFYSDEAVRMTRVQRNFVVIKYAELILIAGAAMALLALNERPALAGVALGILISAPVLLAFDWFAERRGDVYLQTLTSQAGPG